MSLKFLKDRPISIKRLLDPYRYPVDLNYQREPGAWSREDEQYFIDSLLKKINIPKIYLHKKRSRYWIIDGQQRIETIRKFITDKDLKLSNEITGRKKDQITFNDLRKNEKRALLDYKITATMIQKGSDNEIRLKMTSLIFYDGVNKFGWNKLADVSKMARL